MNCKKLLQVPLRVIFYTFYNALVFPFLSRNLLTQTMLEDHKGQL